MNVIEYELLERPAGEENFIWQFDRGQKLRFLNAELPVAYEVHFSNKSTGSALKVLGDSTGVTIPYDITKTGKPAYFWLYIVGENEEKTIYGNHIPVRPRADVPTATPTPEEQGFIEQAIASLNAGVAHVEAIEEAIPATVTAEIEAAIASGRLKGDPGAVFTPSVSDGVMTWTNNGDLPNPDPTDFNQQLGLENFATKQELAGKVDNGKIGQPNGVAALDETGHVPSELLPSYVDDIVEYPSVSQFPTVGESGKIYISTSNNHWYRWTGSQYFDMTSVDVSAKADKRDTILETTLSRGRKANTNVGTASVAFGNDVVASGDYSQAFGQNTVASGEVSHAEGGNTVAYGSYSHAEGIGGIFTKNSTYYTSGATGQYSHSEGDATAASGTASHTEGHNTIASDDYTHAEGVSTIASNYAAHAEGANTTASGQYSHSEGANTVASGLCSHSEGGGTSATEQCAHSEGSGTQATGVNSHAEGGNTYATASQAHAEGGGTHAIASQAHAEGGGTIASGEQSHAEGASTIAANTNAHAEGAGGTYTINDITYESGAYGTNSHTEGNKTYASADGAHAEGYETRSTGTASHAEGAATQATGVNSHAEGTSTTASGDNSHSEGAATTASASQSHAEGTGSTASGNYSHAEGENTTSSGMGSHSEGGATTASGNNSHSEGAGTTASGMQSHAEGGGTSATGTQAHSEGGGTTASGNFSHAEGGGSRATGNGSHAEGAGALAEGEVSHAEGASTTASGRCSHAEGYQTTAAGAYSHVSGIQNVLDSYDSWTEWSVGTYVVGDKVKRTRIVDEQTVVEGYVCSTANSDAEWTPSHWENQNGRMNFAEIVGNGTGNEAKSNARALDWEGNEYLKGDVYVGCNEDSSGGTKLLKETDIVFATDAHTNALFDD